MRKIILSFIIMTLTTMAINTSFALADKIYIVETMLEADIATSKSRIGLFKSDGTKLDSLTINGTLARVSPDGKSIVYMERTNDSWSLAFADSTGKKTGNPKCNLDRYGKVVKLFWAPDGDKIAILHQFFNREVILNILFLKNNELKKIVSIPAQRSEDAFFYSLQWLQDSRRVLIGGLNGLKIIDINSTETEDISKDSAVAAAHLMNNANKILYITTPRREQRYGMSERGGAPKILIYDLEKKISEEKLFIKRPPLSILSDDGRYLAFNYLGEPGLLMLDLMNNKVIKKDTKGLMLIPKKFSPTDKNS